jgi:hypothetical protein
LLACNFHNKHAGASAPLSRERGPAGDFDDSQFAELAGLTRYSPVRDIVSNPVPVAIDVARA